ncbi:unnamed protein product [Blepharisma stoltei]|uniref:TmcB/TmcC TPR repeats domain-containing protein n=1 Tax=Blepharisma stoltei TaxID=1481888 RepID=A0AAU9IRE1_9CILI|nr:unnamed protein product [Blepharisma stoltei]
MITILDNEDSISKEIKGNDEFFSQNLFSNKFKNYFFGFFGKVFKPKYSRKTKVRVQIFNEIFINLILVLQLASIAWHPKLTISGWSSYMPIWQYIGYISYDQICARTYSMTFCFYGTLSLVGICFLTFMVFGISFYLKKEIPSLFVILTRKIALSLTTICLVPSVMMFLLVIKYSTINRSTIIEYEGSIKASELDYGALGFVLGASCLLSIVFINFSSENFTSDINHSHHRVNIKARSTVKLDVQRRLFYILICVSYVIFGDYNVDFHQIMVFLYSFYLGLQGILCLDYFNQIANSIQAWKMMTLSVLSLIFIFGRIMDSALIIVIFNIFLQPMVLFAVLWFVNKKTKNLQKITSFPHNQFEFERKYRHLLTNENLAEKLETLELFKIFSKLHHFQKDKLFVIWEFNFCVFVVKDERLARVKLAKIKKYESSFEAEAQEWRLFWWLTMRKCKEFPDTGYLDYLKDYNKLKNQDEVLCYMIIELQSEFYSTHPRIKKIINLVDRVSDSARGIKKGYKNLVDRYKNLEAFEIYASYLENIYNNQEQAEIIKRKKNGMSLYNKRSQEQSLEKYGKDVATILVSCLDDSFGKIVYLNEKATHILKISLTNALETPFNSFIPQPYDLNHDTQMRNFVENCDAIDVMDHKNLCLLDQKGFMIECSVLVKLTAFHNFLYFLVSFKPKATSRQIALISEEGIITSHSELFPYYLGLQEKFLINKKISDLLPQLHYESLEVNEPFMLPLNNSEVALIKLKTAVMSKEIDQLVIIHNDKELKKWLENQDQEQGDSMQTMQATECTFQEEVKAKPKNFEVKFQQSQDISLTMKSYEKTETDFTRSIDNTFIKSNDEEKTRSDKSISFEHFSGFSIKSIHAKKILLNTKKRIRVLQWVLFAVILSVITTVSAILGYMISDVSYSTSLSSFKLVGDLLYDLDISADIARTLDRMILMNISKEIQINQINAFENLIYDLDRIENDILRDFEQWSYCSAADILYKPLVPLWVFDGESTKRSFRNLYDVIGEFIFHGKNMISDVKLGKNYKDHCKFLVINGLGFAYDYTNFTMQGIEDCEIDRVKRNGSIINALLIVGFVALAVLVVIIIGFIILVSKKHDQFWNFVLNNAQYSLSRLKLSCIERLMIIHSIDYNIDTSIRTRQNRLDEARHVKASLYLNYTWRLMIFFAIATSYYFLISLYLYPQCERLMINRPKLLSNFNSRRSLISRMNIFARDLYQPYFILNFPEYYDFSNSHVMLALTSSSLLRHNIEVRQQGFKDLMSQSLIKKLYESYNSTLDLLKYGTEASINTVIFDIEDVSEQTSLWPSDLMAYFLAKISEVQTELGIEFQIADEDSKNIIDSHLNIIIDTTIIYSAALCLLYFCYYLPYLNNQITNLRRFSILPTILDMNTEQI